MNDKETVSLKVVTAAVYDKLNAIMDSDDDQYSEQEQAIIYGTIFLMMAAKHGPAEREQIVELAKSRAICIIEEIKKSQEEEDEIDESGEVSSLI